MTNDKKKWVLIDLGVILAFILENLGRKSVIRIFFTSAEISLVPNRDQLLKMQLQGLL